jgi:alpha-tubulin suppressor-like RCC1 family protein
VSLTRLVARASLTALALLACAARAGAAGDAAVYQWGTTLHGTTFTTPHAIEGLSDVVEVDAGNTSAYALEGDGTVWAWGKNTSGQLGDGTSSDSPTTPQQVRFPAGTHIVAIGEAENSGFALDSDGHAWQWGSVGAGCLTHEPVTLLTPVEIPSIHEAVAVQGGEHHTLWLLRNGTVRACGVNSYGQLGVGGITSSHSPVSVADLDEVVEVSAGELTSCARTKSGAVYVWGSDLNGQVGNGRFETAVFTPFKVPLPGAASEISCGGNLHDNGQTLAIVEGMLYGWGADQFGQVGDGARTNKASPVDTGMRFEHAVAGGVSSYGLTEGKLYSWGESAGGVLGTGTGPSIRGVALVETGVARVSATAHVVMDLHD